MIESSIQLNEDQVQNIVDDLIDIKKLNLNLREGEGEAKYSYYSGKIEMIDELIKHLKLNNGLTNCLFPSELRELRIKKE